MLGLQVGLKRWLEASCPCATYCGEKSGNILWNFFDLSRKCTRVKSQNFLIFCILQGDFCHLDLHTVYGCKCLCFSLAIIDLTQYCNQLINSLFSWKIIRIFYIYNTLVMKATVIQLWPSDLILGLQKSTYWLKSNQILKCIFLWDIALFIWLLCKWLSNYR